MALDGTLLRQIRHLIHIFYRFIRQHGVLLSCNLYGYTVCHANPSFRKMVSQKA